MSLDTIDRITRNAEEVIGALREIALPYETALSIDRSISAIPQYVVALKKEIAEDRRDLLDVIEGLLAGWPDTEIVGYYMPPADHPVLAKAEALKRAAAALAANPE